MFAAHPFILIQMLLAVLLANMNPVLSKVLFRHGWTPISVYFTVLAILSVVLLAHKFMMLERGARWGMKRRDLFGVVLSTITGGVIGPLLFFTGLQYVSASETILMTSMLPFFVVCFGVIFLKERFTLQILFGGVLLSLSLLILLWSDLRVFEISLGVPFLLGSSILSAFTTIVHKKYIVHRHLDSVILVRTILSTLLVGLWMFLVSPDSFLIINSPENIWLMLALPIFIFLVPFFLWFKALRKARAIEAGIVAAIGRVLAILAASTLLNETLTHLHFVSMLFVVFGVLFINVPLTKWRIVPSRLMEMGPLRK